MTPDLLMEWSFAIVVAALSGVVVIAFGMAAWGLMHE
jgi:hypothetical protein